MIVDIFSEVKKLGFSPDQFMVVGSGILAAKGIRQTQDLDILVSPELFQECRSQGWEVKPWTWKGDPEQGWLKKDDVELMAEIRYEGQNVSFEYMSTEAETIDGIKFLSLKQLVNIKRRSGRPKDLDDLKLVERYLQSTIQ